MNLKKKSNSYLIRCGLWFWSAITTSIDEISKFSACPSKAANLYDNSKTVTIECDLLKMFCFDWFIFEYFFCLSYYSILFDGNYKALPVKKWKIFCLVFF